MRLFIPIATLLLVFSCSTIQDKEAREDERKMAEALKEQDKVTATLSAILETPPVTSEADEDAADDPAIWYNSSAPDSSLVLGTNKVAGLHVYDMQSNEIQFLPVGKVNNVDVLDDFQVGEQTYAVAGASNRSKQAIDIFLIDKHTRHVSHFGEIKTNVDDVYGFCLSKIDSTFYAYSNGKNGVIEQFEFTGSDSTLISKKVRELRVNSQPEGMVIDSISNTLFVGVEDEGIIKFDANPSDSLAEWLKQSKGEENDKIVYDIEGLSIFDYSQKRYLIASIQGSFTYALFEISPNEKYVTSFKIANGKIDGVMETDGLDVVSLPINSTFPQGLLVVQDGFNNEGDSIANQNFKYVSLGDVFDLIDEE